MSFHIRKNLTLAREKDKRTTTLDHNGLHGYQGGDTDDSTIKAEKHPSTAMTSEKENALLSQQQKSQGKYYAKQKI